MDCTTYDSTVFLTQTQFSKFLLETSSQIHHPVFVRSYINGQATITVPAQSTRTYNYALGMAYQVIKTPLIKDPPHTPSYAELVKNTPSAPSPRELVKRPAPVKHNNTQKYWNPFLHETNGRPRKKPLMSIQEALKNKVIAKTSTAGTYQLLQTHPTINSEWLNIQIQDRKDYVKFNLIKGFPINPNIARLKFLDIIIEHYTGHVETPAETARKAEQLRNSEIAEVKELKRIEQMIKDSPEIPTPKSLKDAVIQHPASPIVAGVTKTLFKAAIEYAGSMK